MLSRAQNTFHHNPHLRGPVSSYNKVTDRHATVRFLSFLWAGTGMDKTMELPIWCARIETLISKNHICSYTGIQHSGKSATIQESNHGLGAFKKNN